VEEDNKLITSELEEMDFLWARLSTLQSIEEDGNK
jgi:hypothetical protein